MEQEQRLKKWDNDREEKKEDLSNICLHTLKETCHSKKHNETEAKRKVEITYKSQLQTYMNQQHPKTSEILQEIKMMKLKKTSD